MGAYALIAAGLLNWDYQRDAPNIAAHSLAIIIPGALLLAATFVGSTKALLLRRSGQFLTVMIGIAALSYAFIN